MAKQGGLATRFGAGLVAAFLAGGDQPKPSHGYALTAALNESKLPASSVQTIDPLTPATMHMDSAPTHLAADAEAEQGIRSLFLKGEFAAADQLVKTQLAMSALSLNYKNWLKTQEPMIKLGWAWSLIRQKNCAEALPLLESIQDPNSLSSTLKGIGYCLLQKKDFATAGSYLERYLDKNKNDPEAYILLAESKESMGEAHDALELAQQASSLQNLSAGESRELKRREESFSSKAEESAGQTEMTSGFIRLRYQELTHQDLASPAIAVMQSTLVTLNLSLSLPYPAEPIEVIFHKSENFGKIAHSPAWTAGIYDGRVRIPIPDNQVFDQELAKILRHEIAHAVLAEHAQHRNLPAWFQEGLAQVAECPQLCWHFQFAATSFPFLPPEAFNAGFMSLNRGEAQVAYKQSLYLMQVLNYQFNGIPGIKQILEQIPQIQDLSSDGLLNQISQNFAALHAKAQESWRAQRSF